MTTLKRWGDERPDADRWETFVVYWPDGGLFIGSTIVHELSPHPLPDNARWCYVPDAPDWNKLDG